jgi:uncharacterized protein (DUF2235 family)
MTKQIIFCADGTWNGPEEQTGVSATDSASEDGELPQGAVTNVVKLFSNLAGHVTAETMMLQNEQEKVCTDAGGRATQVAKYIHGVGDSSNLLIKLLGGTIGFGLLDRIVRGYTFISRNYEPGDQIHLVGFSRGAYTVRALAGMIAKVGLLNPKSYDVNDKTLAYRYAVAAWARSKTLALNGAGKLTTLANSVLNVLQFFVGEQLPPNGLIAGVPIKSVAVWDTVGSMGIPIYAGDQRYDVFRFVDTTLSNSVENGLHAMAIDELRRDFPVTRWDTRQNIKQVWFVGAHCDVGGGYPPPESRFSDVALSWMSEELRTVGVQFATPAHYVPDIRLDAALTHEPWGDFPFDTLPTCPREVLASDTLHSSVRDHWNAGTYRPQAMAKLAATGLSGFNIA